MIDYRDILRLHYLGRSQRSIALEVQSSRDTVAATLTAARAAGISWPVDEITNEDVQEILFPGKYAMASPHTAPDYDLIHRELAKTGVTLSLIFWSGNTEKSGSWRKSPSDNPGQSPPVRYADCDGGCSLWHRNQERCRQLCTPLQTDNQSLWKTCLHLSSSILEFTSSMFLRKLAVFGYALNSVSFRTWVVLFKIGR